MIAGTRSESTERIAKKERDRLPRALLLAPPASAISGSKEAGIGHLGTHAFRHTYRSWLDAVGTPIAVQQKLMRHSDVRTTMNIYGEVVTDEMGQAHSKVVGLALSRPA